MDNRKPNRYPKKHNISSELKDPDLWSVEKLNKLSEDDLIDRLFSVTSQSMLIKWRLSWELRKRYPSAKLFKKRINELMSDPTYAFCVGKQQDMHRAALAGKFCEKYKIKSLEGMFPTAIYELSKKNNEDIADAVFHEVKSTKYLSVMTVQKLISQAKNNDRVVLTIEKPIDTDELDREPVPLRIIQVDNGVAMEPVFNEQTEPAINENEGFSESTQQRRLYLLYQLSKLDAACLTDAEIKNEWGILEPQYGRTDLQLAGLYREKVADMQNRIYRK